MFKNSHSVIYRRPLDLLLCDFQMPKLNGMELIQKLRTFISRQNQLNEKIKLVEPHIVIVSAYLTQQMKKHLTSAGITNLFEKPVPPETM